MSHSGKILFYVYHLASTWNGFKGNHRGSVIEYQKKGDATHHEKQESKRVDRACMLLHLCRQQRGSGWKQSKCCHWQKGWVPGLADRIASNFPQLRSLLCSPPCYHSQPCWLLTEWNIAIISGNPSIIFKVELVGKMQPTQVIGIWYIVLKLWEPAITANKTCP